MPADADNAAMARKARFYVPDSVEHCTAGIGLASVHWFLARNHNVVLINNDSPTLATNTQSLSASQHAMSILCHVSDPDPDQLQSAFAQIVARFGSAHAIGFLCGKAAGYVNGQVLAVDGGFDAMGVGLPTLRRDAAEKGG